MSQSPVLIYLHIPKTAGTTLREIMLRQYKDAKILFTNKLSPQEVERLSDKDISKSELVIGHLPFSIHHQFNNSYRYITMLRNPVDRVISQYYYVLRNPDHRMYHIIYDQQIPLAQYVTSNVSTVLDNHQVRVLCGLKEADPFHFYPEEQIPPGEANQHLLELAKANLQECLVVGITERFDESLILLKRTLNWHWPFYVKQNTASNRPNSIDEAVKQQILERNTLDQELYIYANQLLDQAIQQQGMVFWAELRLFQVLNKVYASVQELLRLARKIKARLTAYRSR